MKFIVATLLMTICFSGVALVRKDYFPDGGMGTNLLFIVIETIVAGGFIYLIKNSTKARQ